MFSDHIPTKQKPPKFLLECLLAFTLRFAPVKISRYTVFARLSTVTLLAMDDAQCTKFCNDL